MGKLRIKRPSELSREERSMHLGLYPLILIPLGLYMIFQAMDDGHLLYLITGAVVAVSPFLILLTTSPPPDRKM